MSGTHIGAANKPLALLAMFVKTTGTGGDFISCTEDAGSEDEGLGMNPEDIG
jgi:hypothetical protein